MDRSLSSDAKAEHLNVIKENGRKLEILNAQRIDYERILEDTKKKIAQIKVETNQALAYLGFGDSSSSEASNRVNDSSSDASIADLVGPGYELITEVARVDLTPTVGMLKSRPQLSEESSVFIETGHSFKIRNIEFFATNPNDFITSGDDGFIRKWEMTSNANANKVLTFDAMYNGSFPEDVAINPADGTVVAGYRHQERLMLFSLISEQELGDRARGTEIEETPHQKGLSQVMFMPWHNNGNQVFVSSGSLKHEVVAWGLFNRLWQTTALYKIHTGCVTGIAGHLETFKVISVGRDKRIVVFDLEQEVVANIEKVDAQCVGVAANPIDSNLLCVQTSLDGEQLRLLDMRYGDQEAAVFGWKKPDNLKNSALVSPAWSPSGLLLTAGSGGRQVKVFDIRYLAEQKPLTCEDTGKVYKVAWAPTREVLISGGGTKLRMHSLNGKILP